MTKGLPSSSFEAFRLCLGVLPDAASIEGGCQRR
jgi:hypothetical protein